MDATTGCWVMLDQVLLKWRGRLALELVRRYNTVVLIPLVDGLETFVAEDRAVLGKPGRGLLYHNSMPLTYRLS